MNSTGHSIWTFAISPSISLLSWPSVRTDALPMITLSPSQGDVYATALLVYLDPMAVGLSDVEPSLPIQFYRHWSPEIGLGLGGDVVGSVDVRWQFRDQVGHLPRAFLVWVDVEEVRSPLGQRACPGALTGSCRRDPEPVPARCPSRRCRCNPPGPLPRWRADAIGRRPPRTRQS